MNSFIKKSLKPAKTTEFGKGSVKLVSTGSEIVDQFSSISKYKDPRNKAQIRLDQSKLMSNPLLGLCFIIYCRLITRVINLGNSKTKTTQRGQGLKHESLHRMYYVGIQFPELFYKNLPVFILAGSWKDIFELMLIDLENGWERRLLDWSRLVDLIKRGLASEQSELIKKYLPVQVSRSKALTIRAKNRNIIAKYLVEQICGSKNYIEFRKLKTSGTAHQWQQVISKNQMNKLDFGTIHGRALQLLIKGKFLANQGLESKFTQWILNQPTAKFTGYPYELFSPFSSNGFHWNDMPFYKETLANKQFLELVKKGKNGILSESSFIGVVDTSGSMMSQGTGTTISCMLIAKVMALYLSYLAKGVFQDVYFEFSRSTHMRQWQGTTPLEKLKSVTSSIVGDTNFLSIADHFNTLKKKGIPLEDFPTGIICFSDGCFNSTSSNKTTYKQFKEKLKKHFPKDWVKNFKVILWDIQHYGYSNKGNSGFEGESDTKGLIHLSGCDPAVLGFLFGASSEKVPSSTEEIMNEAFSQEIMSFIEI